MHARRCSATHCARPLRRAALLLPGAGEVSFCGEASGWAAPAAAGGDKKKKKKAKSGGGGDGGEEAAQHNGEPKELDPEKAAKKVRSRAGAACRCRCCCCRAALLRGGAVCCGG